MKTLLLSALALACVNVTYAKSVDALRDIDADVEAVMAQLHVPGAAVGVIREGKVILAKGYGVRSAEQGARVDADTIFSIASLSKSFTTAAMAVLVDEAKLDWDQPVRKYLPWFEMYDSVATQLMTPRDLVSHRSGLPRHDFLRFSTYLQPAELVKRLRYLPPSRTFRDGYQYNNLMYATAGYLAGEVAGSTWDEVVRTRIFAPLAMTRSNTSPLQSAANSNHAVGHRLSLQRAEPIPFYQYGKFGVAPAGAVGSTVNDMLKYLQMHLDDGKAGGRQVISTTQVRELHRPVTIQSEGSAYALGWGRTQRQGQTVLQHGGSIDGFTAQMILLPDSQAGIVVLNNLEGSRLPARLGDRIADRLLGASKKSAKEMPRRDTPARELPPRIANTHPTLAVEEYAGSYVHPAYGSIRVTRSDSGLDVQFEAVTIPLTHYHYDTFHTNGYAELEEGLWQFRLDAAGRVQQLLAPLEPQVPPLVFVRQK